MRLWSLHPSYLDTKGLLALWREGLLARHVLAGKTRGYKSHPQLIRFRESANPQAAINVYLRAVVDEAVRRGYSFDETKIGPETTRITIPVTSGQVLYEAAHLLKKLEKRDPERFRQLKDRKIWKLHPLFRKVRGEVEAWERQ
jgi:hypothetical protein